MTRAISIEGASLIATLKRLWKNEYIQIVTILSLIVLIFLGFWYGLTIALNNPNPIVVVPSGSMCIPYNGACDGWGHPFELMGWPEGAVRLEDGQFRPDAIDGGGDQAVLDPGQTPRSGGVCGPARSLAAAL